MQKKRLFMLLVILSLGAWALLRATSGPLTIVSIPVTSSESTPSESASDLKKEVKPETIAAIQSTLNGEDQNKMKILNEILVSKNDNDPRMDRELMVLSADLKKALRKNYEAIAVEKRNDLGTIVFLLGRNIKEPSDVEFFKSVLMEKPCLSLSDCGKAAAPPTGEQEHLEGINETTANYPQLNALRSLVDAYATISKDPSGNRDLQAAILKAIEDSRQSPNPKVASLAEQALKLLKDNS